LETFTNDYSRKPRKNPRIFPQKSRGNLRHFRKIFGNFRKFRKISEIVPGKSSILEAFTNDYSLKPRKNPGIFPPKSGGNPENVKPSGKSLKIPEILGDFGNFENSGNSTLAFSTTEDTPFLNSNVMRTCT
jgi:hypothetical protein